MNALTDKTIVVTGSSRGIGAGIAQVLAAQGARLAVTYSANPDAAKKVVESLTGSGHLLINLNVADSASVEKGFAEILE